MKKLLLTILFLFLFSVPTRATVIFDAGAFTAEYTEPTLSADDTVLDDLDHTTIYYRINSGDWVNAKEVPASSLSGGVRASYPFTVDLSAMGANIQANIEIGYTATDTSDNESTMYIEPSLTRIDQVSPKTTNGIIRITP